MSAWVIVALPKSDDPVWKVSSEKVPHMTLVYLGEQNDLDKADRMVQFIDHLVALSPGPFYLDVDHRGVLGSDKADVVFFNHLASTVDEFRTYLLRQPDIKEAYDSVEQYPTWTPHLTLGYPNSPAKTTVDDVMGWVIFDRIALWTDDFAGPEFRLTSDSMDTVPASMADKEYEEALVHFGVKGMRWGVRNNRTPGVSNRTDREARKDAEEFARAKMFYGEGAGTRRKLINATVKAKSQKDPAYAKAFDAQMNRQDMSKHAEKARGERKRKDISTSTRKTARGFRHVLNGNSQYASMTAALLAGGFLYARKTGIDQTITKTAKTKYQQVRQSAKSKKMVDDLLRNLNLQ